MASEPNFSHSDEHDDQTVQRTSPQPSFGSRLRTVAMWSLVFLVAVVAAFGTGYFLQEREVLDLRQRLVEQRAEAASEVAALERRVLEAEKTQLEQELERATMSLTLSRVLAPLPVALAEVERKNFGNAMERIGAARQALQSPEISPAVREVAGAKLDAIVSEMRAEIGQLQQAGFADRIAVNAEGLQQVLVARYDDTSFFAPMASAAIEAPAAHATSPSPVLAHTAPAPAWYAVPPSGVAAPAEAPPAPAWYAVPPSVVAAPAEAPPAPALALTGQPAGPMGPAAELRGTADAADIAAEEEAHAASESETEFEVAVEPVAVAPVKEPPFWWMKSTSAPVASVNADPATVAPATSIGGAKTEGRYRWSWEVENDVDAEGDEAERDPTDPAAAADAKGMVPDGIGLPPAPASAEPPI